MIHKWRHGLMHRPRPARRRDRRHRSISPVLTRKCIFENRTITHNLITPFHLSKHNLHCNQVALYGLNSGMVFETLMSPTKTILYPIPYYLRLRLTISALNRLMLDKIEARARKTRGRRAWKEKKKKTVSVRLRAGLERLMLRETRPRPTHSSTPHDSLAPVIYNKRPCVRECYLLKAGSAFRKFIY